MPYSLLPAAPSVEAALHRLALDQLGRARASLDADGEALHEAVHDARKRIKKVRGLIRLVRGAFPAYSGTNKGLRDTARLISGLRDRTALIETLDRLGERGGRPGQETAAPLREKLVADREAAIAADDLQDRLAEARSRLDALVAEIPDWSLTETGWTAMAPGLSRTYARAREGAAMVREDPRPETVHEWRKRVKYHWYHTRLLQGLWPELLKARADALDELTDLLGENHDLAVLTPHLEGADLDAEGRETLMRLAARLTAENQARADALGARLFADKPKALVRRWKAFWKLRDRE